jgi:penicillin amidase
VFGFSLPGTPGVVIGQTAHVAWGFTNVTADTQDLFVIDRERDVIRTRREEIRVRGRRRPEVLLVAETRHGPVVTDPRADEPRGLALRWTGLEPSATIGALRGVVHARTVDEVVEAMRGYGGATLNMLCADRDGGTAFKVVGGPVPVRGRGQGLVPLDAAAPDADWRGTVPYDELPGGRGTDGGVLVTANERIVPDAYPHLISHEWLNAYRAERIREVLEGLDRISVEDCVRLQPDVRSLPGLRLQALLADARPRTGRGPGPRAATRLGRRAAADSSGGAVGGGAPAAARPRDVRRGAQRARAVPRLVGFSLLTAAVPFFGRTTPALLDALERRDDTFFRDGRTWDDVVAVRLTRTVRELELACGPRSAPLDVGRRPPARARPPAGRAARRRPRAAPRPVPRSAATPTRSRRPGIRWPTRVKAAPSPPPRCASWPTSPTPTGRASSWRAVSRGIRPTRPTTTT